MENLQKDWGIKKLVEIHILEPSMAFEPFSMTPRLIQCADRNTRPERRRTNKSRNLEEIGGCFSNIVL